MISSPSSSYNIVPVSILSLTIQLPATNTASHCIIQPDRGISITSPGTRSSDDDSIYSVNKWMIF